MVNKPNTGNFDNALTSLLTDLGNGQLSHEEILHRWDTNRGDDWYTRPVRKGNQAAFPLIEKAWDGAAFQRSTGMSLRAYFAGQAIVAMGQWTPADNMVRGELIAAMGDPDYHDKVHRLRAAFAVAAADALIAALDE